MGDRIAAPTVRAGGAWYLPAEPLGCLALRTARKARSSRPRRSAHRRGPGARAAGSSARPRSGDVRGRSTARGRPCRRPAGCLRRSRRAVGSVGAMAVVTETIQISGIRCERCVMRLAKVLEGHEGLEEANANLMGQVTLAWDDERTKRDALLEAMARGGFRELA
ncbi:MAG: cation transporter [Actinobacteria bacterium]|nr:MAG: cation transporter [Actinomycetota bacterium]